MYLDRRINLKQDWKNNVLINKLKNIDLYTRSLIWEIWYPNKNNNHDTFKTKQAEIRVKNYNTKRLRNNMLKSYKRLNKNWNHYKISSKRVTKCKLQFNAKSNYKNMILISLKNSWLSLKKRKKIFMKSGGELTKETKSPEIKRLANGKAN
jgi:hypothetical protein